jgi:hypothetical protein
MGLFPLNTRKIYSSSIISYQEIHVHTSFLNHVIIPHGRLCIKTTRGGRQGRHLGKRVVEGSKGHWGRFRDIDESNTTAVRPTTLGKNGNIHQRGSSTDRLSRTQPSHSTPEPSLPTKGVCIIRT